MIDKVLAFSECIVIDFSCSLIGQLCLGGGPQL